MGFLDSIKKAFSGNKDSEEYLNGFSKTNANLGRRLRYISSEGKVDANEFIDELMVALIDSDIGFHTAEKICNDFLNRADYYWRVRSKDMMMDLLTEAMRSVYGEDNKETVYAEEGPTVILMIGVNGSGKTTTCAKLARRYQNEGKKVAMAAADTFRAGAIDQLKQWGERLDVPVVAGKDNEDPSSVLVEACRYAKANDIDILICDTAGRLQTKKNLMAELEKMYRVVGKEIPGAPHNVWLVIDANTGQNGISQAELFNDTAKIDGIILTKMDGTAKGGIVLAIKSELGLPVKYIGFGEKLDDLKEFDVDLYLYSIIEDFQNEH
ncbi:MAG: signal recognition particle-docking protein FtsY [Erysipelotrichaceae bacterium]|nr:signal recognition particle-docking protein FtsY [Erysipelotrichaceae bacterium]